MSYPRIIVLGSMFLLLAGCQSWQYRDVSSLPPPAALPATSQPGVVHAFYWDNIQGSKVSDLIASVEYPDSPSEIVELNSLEGISERGSNYGTIVKGYIRPPTTGDYRFFVSGDDETQFWLSSDSSAADIKLTASVTGWTFPDSFDKYSSQTSAIQRLESGRSYYFEIRHKEADGGDHYSVAWEGPGINQEIITGAYLQSIAQEQGIEAEVGSKEAYSLGYRVGFLDGTEGIPFNAEYPMLDRDNDGIYDNWEVVNGLDPNNSDDAKLDPDGDLLSASDEFLIGTSESNSDTDADGIPDGAEFALGLNPLDADDAQQDLDNDGFTNLEEYNANTSINDPTDQPTDQPTDTTKVLAGFSGQYYEGTNFDRFILVRNDPTINFSWGYGSPEESVPVDNFSVRWSALFTAPHTSGERDYQFTVTSDDGVRLFLNGERVINDWSDHAETSFRYTATFNPGVNVPLVVEYYEKGYDAIARLEIVDMALNQAIDVPNHVTTLDLTVESAQDSDSDGIPDVWELQQGLNRFLDDSKAVLNNANVSNFEAYQNDLDPWTLEPIGDAEPETTTPSPDGSVTGSVTLTWTAPSTRIDGTSIALSEIDYYVISYGDGPNNLTNTVQVDGAETTYQFDNLAPGTWYFVIRVVDTGGLSSPDSSPVSTQID